MAYSPLAIKRRNVLGEIYTKCEAVSSIPVYLNSRSDEPLGFADESLGHYADAFLFHLPENICKQLSTGHFDYVLYFDYSEETVGEQDKIQLESIMLVPRKIPV